MLTAASMQKQKLDLGLPGYSYADLYDPAKLRTLFEEWHRGLHAAASSPNPQKSLNRFGEGWRPSTIRTLPSGLNLI